MLNYTAPVGLLSGRFLKSLAVGKGDMNNAIAYAMGKQGAWQQTTPELYPALRSWNDLTLKTAVTANDSSSAAGLMVPGRIQSDFMGLVQNASAFARLSGVRRFPANMNVVSFTSGSSAAIVDEGARVPISAASLVTTSLAPKKVAGMVVVVNEVLLNASADQALASDLARAVANASDQAMLDPASAISIANGATSFASTGSTVATITTDLQRAINLMAAGSRDQSLASASWIMSTTAAAFLAGLHETGASNAFADCTAVGGSIWGIPVLTTSAASYSGSPAGSSVLLVDGSQVAQNSNDSIDLTASDQGSLVMDSAPPAGPQQEVSLFQTNSTAILALRWIAAARQKASSVIAITSVAWA